MLVAVMSCMLDVERNDMQIVINILVKFSVFIWSLNFIYSIKCIAFYSVK